MINEQDAARHTSELVHERDAQDTICVNRPLKHLDSPTTKASALMIHENLRKSFRRIKGLKAMVVSS